MQTFSSNTDRIAPNSDGNYTVSNVYKTGYLRLACEITGTSSVYIIPRYVTSNLANNTIQIGVRNFYNTAIDATMTVNVYFIRLVKP